MVNSEDFIKRLEMVLDYYTLTASSFADKIGVQRSSLSHLLSGRNKPSLDFILKITAVFPEIDLYWILNGKGSFPKDQADLSDPAVPDPIEHKEADLFSGSEEDKKTEKPTLQPVQRSTAEGIEKIVIFYNDGTFSEFKPR